MPRNPLTSFTAAVPPRAFLAAGGALVTALAMLGAVSDPTSASAELAANAVIQPRAAIGNPVAGNSGFLAFVHKNADLSSNENEGTIALGGDLLLHGDYRVSNYPPSHPFVVDGDAEPTGLLIGGKIDWANSSPTGKLQVLSQAYVKLGNQSGTDILDPTTLTDLVPNGSASDSPKHVILTTDEPEAAVVKSGLIDFDTAFANYEQRSAEMAACDSNVVPTDANGNQLMSPWSVGTQAYLTLSTTQTNVWTVTTSQLAALGNITLRNQPGASAPLVINVIDDSGTGKFTWNAPALANFGGTAAPYVLWNFPKNTNVTLTGGNSIDGTIYAPKADLVDLSSGNIQGNVIVNNLVHGGPDGGDNGGEIHDFAFAGDVECGDTTPTTSMPTNSPSINSVSPTESTPGGGSTSPAASTGPATPSTGNSANADASRRAQLAATGVDHASTTLLLAAACLTAGLILVAAAATRRRKNGHRRH
jgi:choice-of-anchor A domain-containing protein